MKGTPLQTSVISLENIRKSRKGGFHLGPVNLEIEPGRIIAVVGPNGSGKSTLFGMLMNLLRPDSGNLNLFGMAHPRNEVAIKQRIGYVPERATGRDDMSAEYLGDFVSHWYPNWDQEHYEDLIFRAQIHPRKKFGQLSEGLQRRVLFALALAAGPQLLLLDEPTAGVDLLARKEMGGSGATTSSGALDPRARRAGLAAHRQSRRRTADRPAARRPRREELMDFDDELQELEQRRPGPSWASATGSCGTTSASRRPRPAWASVPSRTPAPSCGSYPYSP